MSSPLVEKMVLRGANMSLDRNFIHATWHKSYKSRERRISKLVYSVGQDAVINRLIDESNFVVACDEEDSDIIHGWACGDSKGENPILHYCYVPPMLAKLGLGRALITSVLDSYDDIIETSHLWPWDSDRFVYNPYVLRV